MSVLFVILAAAGGIWLGRALRDSPAEILAAVVVAGEAAINEGASPEIAEKHRGYLISRVLHNPYGPKDDYKTRAYAAATIAFNAGFYEGIKVAQEQTET